jgi:type IV pilus assembly protein PilA
MKIKRNSGFTLIELMIVVAIIAIIAAIAIPSLLRSRMAANEAAALGSLRQITTGQVSYQAAVYEDANGDGLGDYAGDLNDLASPPGPGDAEGFIDEVLAGGEKQGYSFTLAAVAGGAAVPPSFTVNADPQVAGTTGIRQFFVNQSGVIRFNIGGPASADDPPVQ